MYILKFWFEHGGICIWSANDVANGEYGYAVSNEQLPISNELVDILYALEDEYAGCLDWSCPQNPSPWTEVQKNTFRDRANDAYNRLIEELGNQYEVINKIDECIYS